MALQRKRQNVGSRTEEITETPMETVPNPMFAQVNKFNQDKGTLKRSVEELGRSSLDTQLDDYVVQRSIDNVRQKLRDPKFATMIPEYESLRVKLVQLEGVEKENQENIKIQQDLKDKSEVLDGVVDELQRALLYLEGEYLKKQEELIKSQETARDTWNIAQNAPIRLKQLEEQNQKWKKANLELKKQLNEQKSQSDFERGEIKLEYEQRIADIRKELKVLFKENLKAVEKEVSVKNANIERLEITLQEKLRDESVAAMSVQSVQDASKQNKIILFNKILNSYGAVAVSSGLPALPLVPLNGDPARHEGEVNKALTDLAKWSTNSYKFQNEIQNLKGELINTQKELQSKEMIERQNEKRFESLTSQIKQLHETSQAQAKAIEEKDNGIEDIIFNIKKLISENKSLSFIIEKPENAKLKDNYDSIYDGNGMSIGLNATEKLEIIDKFIGDLHKLATQQYGKEQAEKQIEEMRNRAQINYNGYIAERAKAEQNEKEKAGLILRIQELEKQITELNQKYQNDLGQINQMKANDQNVSEKQLAEFKAKEAVFNQEINQLRENLNVLSQNGQKIANQVEISRALNELLNAALKFHDPTVTIQYKETSDLNMLYEIINHLISGYKAYYNRIKSELEYEKGRFEACKTKFGETNNYRILAESSIKSFGTKLLLNYGYTQDKITVITTTGFVNEILDKIGDIIRNKQQEWVDYFIGAGIPQTDLTVNGLIESLKIAIQNYKAHYEEKTKLVAAQSQLISAPNGGAPAPPPPPPQSSFMEIDGNKSNPAQEAQKTGATQLVAAAGGNPGGPPPPPPPPSAGDVDDRKIPRMPLAPKPTIKVPAISTTSLIPNGSTKKTNARLARDQSTLSGKTADKIIASLEDAVLPGYKFTAPTQLSSNTSVQSQPPPSFGVNQPNGGVYIPSQPVPMQQIPVNVFTQQVGFDTKLLDRIENFLMREREFLTRWTTYIGQNNANGKALVDGIGVEISGLKQSLSTFLPQLVQERDQLKKELTEAQAKITSLTPAELEKRITEREISINQDRVALKKKIESLEEELKKKSAIQQGQTQTQPANAPTPIATVPVDVFTELSKYKDIIFYREQEVHDLQQKLLACIREMEEMEELAERGESVNDLEELLAEYEKENSYLKDFIEKLKEKTRKVIEQVSLDDQSGFGVKGNPQRIDSAFAADLQRNLDDFDQKKMNRHTLINEVKYQGENPFFVNFQKNTNALPSFIPGVNQTQAQSQQTHGLPSVFPPSTQPPFQESRIGTKEDYTEPEPMDLTYGGYGGYSGYDENNLKELAKDFLPITTRLPDLDLDAEEANAAASRSSEKENPISEYSKLHGFEEDIDDMMDDYKAPKNPNLREKQPYSYISNKNYQQVLI